MNSYVTGAYVTLAGLFAILSVSCGGSTETQDSKITEESSQGLSESVVSGDGSFVASGDMKEGRQDISAVLMRDGKIFTAGGKGKSKNFGTGRVQKAEFYDPSTGEWTLTDPMSRERTSVAMAVLPDGKVLVAGGSGGGSAQHATESTEIWDPESGKWTAATDMNVPREQATTVVLNDGRVLVIGGIDEWFGSVNSAETYDPNTGTWTLTTPMSSARNNHTATVLGDGRVIVVGGGKLDGPYTDTAEVYDPSTDSWTSAGQLSRGRAFHTATLLSDGKVLVVGGKGKLKSAELWDPATNEWSAAGETQQPRSEHVAALLPDGTVIAVGGIGRIASSEIYDPNTNSWVSGPDMQEPRYRFTSVTLDDGRIVVFGGTGKDGVLATTELFVP